MELYKFVQKYNPYGVENLGGNWLIVMNIMWAKLGLSMQFNPETLLEEIEESIKTHQKVVDCIIQHADEEDFETKYFYPDGHVKYYQVLDLADSILI